MSDSVAKLLSIMARLRDPEHGCPWDCAQTFSSIVPHTVEEMYEVVDCVEREDYAHLQEELGDLLFQVVFLSRIAEERGLFNFEDVVTGISEKLVRRHPHVFADLPIGSEQELMQMWERIKKEERAQKHSAQQSQPQSVLDDVEAAHPALTHALKLQKMVAKVGFDWEGPDEVFNKVDEELDELKEALREQPRDEQHVEHEMGDILFTCVNLSRHVKVNPETALRKANYRFERRFRCMERIISDNDLNIQSLTINEMEQYWQQAKRRVDKGRGS